MSVIESKSTSIDQLTINTIRTLSMDAVQAANSGHPGTPMALAPVAYTLWQQFLSYDPSSPAWPGRDRFVLSCGHASMLIYSLLHLAQVIQLDQNGKPTGELAVPLEHIKKFRQLHFRTPGHPEHFETTGVETTTGPLGQGCGNSVGMAIAERWLAAHFNRPGFPLFDYNIWVLASDGDLMEGVANEAASIAGHLRPVEPVLDLRRQPHHDRRAHRSGVQRGCRPAVRGAGLERDQGGRRERPAAIGAAYKKFLSDQRQADADHRPQCDRLWLAETRPTRTRPTGRR